MSTMTNNLYEEAIADAKKLRELAEQNAKNAIIESITPKIRELIESQIMGEVDESELDYLKPYNLPIFYYPNIVSFSKGYESKWEELK